MALNRFKNSPRGLGLIEVVVYVALLSLVLILLSDFILQLANTYNRSRAEREVISNARLILETVNKSVSQAERIYAPASLFNINAGQLSLFTLIGAPAEHTGTYVDFWADNGRMMLKRGNAGEVPLSASSVRVNKFFVERITQGLGREAVKITLEMRSASTRYPATITLNSTTALRGNY